MGAGAALVIRTRNSEYCFTIVDVAEGVGLLSGGRLGAQKHVAVLARPEQREVEQPDWKAALRVGSRALFHVEVGGTMKSLVTSVIFEIVHVAGA